MNDLNHSAIQQFALGLASAQLLCFHEIANEDCFAAREKWYDGYRYVVDCIEDGGEPDPEKVCIWQPHENLQWNEVLDEIETQAESFQVQMNLVLDLAKKGLVHSVIEGELDTDFSQVSMEQLVETGHQLDD
jgi:hypothetical protein|tara:strand:- start:9858 stop:10253 length:396 start_codon:yes stop_codon:yes gene_type:complete